MTTQKTKAKTRTEIGGFLDERLGTTAIYTRPSGAEPARAVERLEAG